MGMWFCHQRLRPKITVWMFGTTNVYKITYMIHYIGNFTELHRTLLFKFWHALHGPYYHSKVVSTTPLWRRQLGVDMGGRQCSRMKSSMSFKCDLALQNIPLSKQPFRMQPQTENEDVTWSPQYNLPTTRTNKRRALSLQEVELDGWFLTGFFIHFRKKL
jgi:hypothetical protein